MANLYFNPLNPHIETHFQKVTCPGLKNLKSKNPNVTVKIDANSKVVGCIHERFECCVPLPVRPFYCLKNQALLGGRKR